MSNPVSLATSLAKYFGPDFKSVKAALREIRQRRSENLEAQVARDENLTKELLGNSERPITHTELDDLALANPKIRMKLATSSANHGETDTIDHHTFVDEGRRLSQLLEKYTEGEIDQIRKFFLVTLASEGPKLLERLEGDDATTIREIIATVKHLAFDVTPYVVEHNFTPDAQARYTRLNPLELMETIARKN